MGLAASEPLFTLMLLMMLVVLAGTALFAALHPRFFRRMIQGETADGKYAWTEFRRIRWGGLVIGAIVLMLLLLMDRIG